MKGIISASEIVLRVPDGYNWFILWIQISSEEGSDSTSSESESDIESSMESSETSSSESSSSVDQFQPGPAKKAKVLKPKKALAKLAKKKGDKKSEKSILKHVKEAEKVTSEKVGPEMEKELVRIEKNMTKWQKKGVEKEALQRFIGRIMRYSKQSDIFVSCDHAVFLNEMGLISLVEMDLTGTLNETGPVTPEQARVRSNRLLSLIIDQNVRERIQQTWDGMAWMDRSHMVSTFETGKFWGYGH